MNIWPSGGGGGASYCRWIAGLVIGSSEAQSPRIKHMRCAPCRTNPTAELAFRVPRDHRRRSAISGAPAHPLQSLSVLRLPVVKAKLVQFGLLLLQFVDFAFDTLNQVF